MTFTDEDLKRVKEYVKITSGLKIYVIEIIAVVILIFIAYKNGFSNGQKSASEQWIRFVDASSCFGAK